MPPLRPTLAVFVVPTSRLSESLRSTATVWTRKRSRSGATWAGALLATSVGAQVELVEQAEVANVPEPRVALDCR